MSVSKAIKSIGKRYGRLKVLEIIYKDTSGLPWAKCKCKCGNDIIIITKLQSLRSGNTTSCGCKRREHLILKNKANRKYKNINERTTPEYIAFFDMRQRCYDIKFPFYHNYGGRGISVFKPWLHKKKGYKRFLKWLLSDEGIGRRPNNKYSIDRYPDNDGNYEPGNLRWATAEQQANNRRNNKVDKNFKNG